MRPGWLFAAAMSLGLAAGWAGVAWLVGQRGELEAEVARRSCELAAGRWRLERDSLAATLEALTLGHGLEAALLSCRQGPCDPLFPARWRGRYTLTLMDPRGGVVSRAGNPARGGLAYPDVVARAKESGGPVWGVESIGEDRVLVHVRPVWSASGELLGLLAGELPLDDRVARDLATVAGAHVALVAPGRGVLGRSWRGDPASPGDLPTDLAPCEPGPGGWLMVSRRAGLDVVLRAMPLPHLGGLSGRTFPIAVAGVALSLGLFGWLASTRRITRAVEGLARAIASGEVRGPSAYPGWLRSLVVEVRYLSKMSGRGEARWPLGDSVVHEDRRELGEHPGPDPGEPAHRVQDPEQDEGLG